MYAKIFTSLYQGTLRGNAHGILVFTNLLAHADSKGNVDITPRAIAEEVGLTVDEVKAALIQLESPDEESRSPEMEGRRIVRVDEHRSWGWFIVNYAKYRAIRNEEDRRCQLRESQRVHREKKKMQKDDYSNQSKPSVINVSRDKPMSSQAEAEAEAEANKNIKHLSASADVIEVFDHWRSRMNHERANLDAKRSKLIKSAMKIGYSKADLIEAIDGCAKSPFHMGQNQDGKVYDGLDLILRDASKIDGFIKTNRMPSLPAIGGGNATNRPYQDRPDNSAAGRVRANIARERAAEAAAEAAEGKDSGFVADDVIDVWPQMGDVIRF